MVNLLIILAMVNGPQAINDAKRAYQGGPVMNDARRHPGVTAHKVLGDMFAAMEKHWFVDAYRDASYVDFRATISADLPARAVDRRLDSDESVDFNVRLDGISAPNGRYRMKLDGGLGDVEMTRDGRRSFLTSQDFKSFADTPIRARSANANLTNYRSYLLRYVGRLKAQIFEGNGYRTTYVGTGSHQGRQVDVVHIYKPRLGKARNKKRPMALERFWTFWHDGSYELWIDKITKLPVIVFYTNADDNVFANFDIDYDRQFRPVRIRFVNNTVDAEGSGDLTMDFDRSGLLKSFNLRFDGRNGISLRFDANLEFISDAAADAFRIVAPYGYRKINRDHLKLMILTQLSGGLLKLKKHGVNIRNFKF